MSFKTKYRYYLNGGQLKKYFADVNPIDDSDEQITIKSSLKKILLQIYIQLMIQIIKLNQV